MTLSLLLIYSTKNKALVENISIMCILMEALLNSTAEIPGYCRLHTGISLFTMQKSHQLTTMLATSENVLFPGHKHLLATGTDDPSL